MDFRKGEKEPLSVSYIKWLGFELVNGAWEHPKVEGELQFVGGKYVHTVNNIGVKTLKTCKDLTKIVHSSKS